MNFNNYYKLLIAFLSLIGLAVFVASCQQQNDVLPEQIASEPSSDAKIEDVEQKLKHIALIMTEVSKTPGVKELIENGVATGYYRDERILLQDLWNPEESQALKNYAKSLSKTAVFKETFQNVYRSKKYLQSESFTNLQEKSTDDLEAYLLANPVSIYYPYSDVSNRQNKSSADREVTFSFNTVEEQDSNIGYRVGNDGEISEVTIDDAYARDNVTFIITQEGFEDGNGGPGFDGDIIDPGYGGGNGGGTGGGTSTPSIPTSLYPSPNQPQPDILDLTKDDEPDLPPNPKVHIVKIAEVQLTQQLDPLFGLKNSGGSEVRLVRAEAFLSNVNNNPTANAGDLIKDLFFTRAAIGEQRWVAANLDMDTDWKLSEQQHFFGIYEEDNGQDEITLSGKVKFTLFDSLGVELSATYTKKFGSKNTRLFNLDVDRTFYFINGFNNANPAVFNETRNGWGVYSDKSYFKFTMPYFVQTQ